MNRIHPQQLQDFKIRKNQNNDKKFLFRNESKFNQTFVSSLVRDEEDSMDEQESQNAKTESRPKSVSK